MLVGSFVTPKSGGWQEDGQEKSKEGEGEGQQDARAQPTMTVLVGGQESTFVAQKLLQPNVAATAGTGEESRRQGGSKEERKVRAVLPNGWVRCRV